MHTDMHGNTPVAETTNGADGRRKSLWKGPALTTAVLMLFPILGSLFVRGWHWKLPGFFVVAAILFTICFTYRLLTRNVDGPAYRAAVAIAFVAGFLLLWGNLVQAFDVNRHAFLYFPVPLVGLIGAAFARLRPRGMARALFATAIAQTLVLLVVLGLRISEEFSLEPPDIRGFAGNAVNALLFATSALLFRKAARVLSAAGET